MAIDILNKVCFFLESKLYLIKMDSHTSPTVALLLALDSENYKFLNTKDRRLLRFVLLILRY